MFNRPPESLEILKRMFPVTLMEKFAVAKVVVEVVMVEPKLVQVDPELVE